MARTKVGNKPKDIREATIGEVAAVGSTAVSVNKIAARAGMAIGTIYRYHETKDDLLFWVFVEAKRDIHNAMMEAAHEQTGAKDRLRAIWFALVNYGFRAPQDFLFVELMSAEAHTTLATHPELMRIDEEVRVELRAGIAEKVLLDVPVSTLETVMASPAITLARRVSHGGVEVGEDELETVFKLVWRGIAA